MTSEGMDGMEGPRAAPVSRGPRRGRGSLPLGASRAQGGFQSGTVRVQGERGRGRQKEPFTATGLDGAGTCAGRAHPGDPAATQL